MINFNLIAKISAARDATSSETRTTLSNRVRLSIDTHHGRDQHLLHAHSSHELAPSTIRPQLAASHSRPRRGARLDRSSLSLACLSRHALVSGRHRRVYRLATHLARVPQLLPSSRESHRA